MTKTTFINQLPLSIQEDIKADLYITLSDVITLDNSINEEIEIAIGGRLCDLEDTINIEKYL